MLKLEITCTGQTLHDLLLALDEGRRRIEAGNITGFDNNDEGSFTFTITGERDKVEFSDLDPFTAGYIEAAFFTDCGENDDGELEGKKYEDLAPETLAKMIADCEAFQEQNKTLIEYEIQRDANPVGRRLSFAVAGHDFWLTRNGHGAGFWDGDYKYYGNVLTEACKAFPEVNLYLGDDGKIYA